MRMKVIGTTMSEDAVIKREQPSLNAACCGRETPWPHAPLHLLSVSGTFFVTAGTYKKLHHFRGAERLGMLHRGLLSVTAEFGWQMEAWAIFSNHYHFVAHSPDDQ